MSKARWSLIIAGALLSVGLARSFPPQSAVKVTYLANEGFLLEGGGRKVLIDALFDGIEGYARPSPELARRLQAAQEPFDGVDLILATHFHDDHFSPEPVRRHLSANPRAVFISTPQAVGRLKADAEASFEGRAFAVHPAEGKVAVHRHNGVRVDVMNLHHGRDRRPPVQNLGFVVHLGGKRVLHIGDTEAGAAEFAALDLSREPVDLALLSGWFLASTGGWRKVITDQIRPRAIGAMHLPTEDAPASYFGSEGGLENRVRRIKNNHPEAEIFTREMQSRVF